MDNSNPYMQRLMTQIWICESSPAAIGSRYRGGGSWLGWNEGQAKDINWLLTLNWERACYVNGRKNKGYVPNIKFVDLELTTPQKDGFREWNWGEADSLACIESMGQEGYKFGTRYDRTNGSWIVSITCAETSLPNFGWCLSARGRSFLHALAVVLYKHLIILRGDWGTSLSEDENDGGWG